MRRDHVLTPRRQKRRHTRWNIESGLLAIHDKRLSHCQACGARVIYPDNLCGACLTEELTIRL